jgi:hypothetical protein
MQEIVDAFGFQKTLDAISSLRVPMGNSCRTRLNDLPELHRHILYFLNEESKVTEADTWPYFDGSTKKRDISNLSHFYGIMTASDVQIPNPTASMEYHHVRIQNNGWTCPNCGEDITLDKWPEADNCGDWTLIGFSKYNTEKGLIYPNPFYYLVCDSKTMELKQYLWPYALYVNRRGKD